MTDINKKMKNRPIGVFDSGVGGLSILRELQHLLPQENFVFVADQLHLPYGQKNKKELIELVFSITNYLVNHHNIKIIVVACNTATCYTINELREKYLFPVVGTVPAIKPAAEKTQNRMIAVISTPSTAQSPILKNLIKDHCRNIKVLNIGCKDLEKVAEQGKFGESENSLLRKYLKKVVNSDTDHLVLGCTHYPFLKKSIKKIIGRHINVIDSGEAIARRTQWLLKNYSLKNNRKKPGKTLYFSTGNAVNFSLVATKLLRHKIQARKVII